MERLKIYKNANGSYEAIRDSILYEFMWNPMKSKVFNFKRSGTISSDYIVKGKLVKSPHIQMIMQVQNKISGANVLVKENIGNILKGKSVQEVIDTKVSILQDSKTKFNNALNIIEYAARDEQLNISHPNYLGFINLSDDRFGDPKMGEALRDFCNLYNGSHYYKGILEGILNQIGMMVESRPDADETIIHNDPQ